MEDRRAAECMGYWIDRRPNGACDLLRVETGTIKLLTSPLLPLLL
jgi:hypothetical protein